MERQRKSRNGGEKGNTFLKRNLTETPFNTCHFVFVYMVKR